MTTQIMTADTDPAPPATTPPRTPEQHAYDAAELIGIVKQMQHYAPSQLYPLLVVARSMMVGEEK